MPISSDIGSRRVSGRGGGTPGRNSRHRAATKQNALNRINGEPVRSTNQFGTMFWQQAWPSRPDEAAGERRQAGVNPSGMTSGSAARYRAVGR